MHITKDALYIKHKPMYVYAIIKCYDFWVEV